MTKLDIRGVRCPITTTRVKRYLKTMKPGDTVEVWTDDKDAVVDLTALITKSGNILDNYTVEVADGYSVYVIRKPV